MSESVPEATGAGRAAGIALVGAGFALAAATLLELGAGSSRGDGDNPAESLDYLEEFGQLYSYSGLAFVAGGVALVTAALGSRALFASRGRSLGLESAAIWALLSGGFFAVAGVMRMQATGTVPHIRSLDQAWGESAYLSVQMVGTQGLLSAGMIGLAGWLIVVAVASARRGVRTPAVFAVFPAAVLTTLLLDLAVPSLAESGASDWIFFGYVVSATLGIPVACIATGATLASARARRRIADAAVERRTAGSAQRV